MTATPCEVLVEGAWVPGTVHAWRRDAERGWVGLVSYRAPIRQLVFAGIVGDARGQVGTFQHWRAAHELRPAQASEPDTCADRSAPTRPAAS